MNPKTTRLQILTSEYEQTKEDERSYTAVYSTLIATGVAVLTALLVFTQQVIDHAGKPDQFPQPLIAVAPMSAVTVVAFSEWIGSRRSVRGFYLRALEREIRAELTKITKNDTDINFQSYQGLKIASLGELLIEHDSLSKYSKTRGGQLIAILATCLTLIFGGITVALGYYTDSHWRWAMLVTYGAFFGQAAQSYVKANRTGRKHFEECVTSYKKRLEVDLLPLDRDTRTWLSYIVLPHPDDLIKSPFTILGLIIGIFVSRVTHNWGVVLSTFFVIEVLVYQTRYILNDCIGIREDQDSPSRSLRRRLPVGRVNDALGWAAVRAAVAIWTILWIKDQPESAGVAARLAILLLLLIFLSMTYEIVRNWERVRGAMTYRANADHDSPSRWRKLHAIIILALVTLGYPLRLVGSIWVIAGPNSIMSGYQLFFLASACVSLGLVFVTSTWILEAFTYVNDTANQGRTFICSTRIRHKYHRMTLARISGFDLRVGENDNTNPSFNNFHALQELEYRNFTPWRVGVAAYHISLISLLYSLFPHAHRNGQFSILLIFVLIVDLLFNSTIVRSHEFYAKLLFCVTWGVFTYFDFLCISSIMGSLISLSCFTLLFVPVFIEKIAHRSGYADVLTMATMLKCNTINLTRNLCWIVWNGYRPKLKRQNS
jgi:membrane protein